ncbi:helix-turn-helix domain-containing protein [Streptomyces sp. NPDC051555]|uniref:helix-turn-helix domain-containing protein n=1 Tax=Streptomyces sp. NPDC051555 TaxID=3365657 RepID=UPI0037B0CC05
MAVTSGTAARHPDALKPVNLRGLTGEERLAFDTRVVNTYTTGGKSIRAIAEATDCSYGAIHTIITSAGVPKRPRGSHPRHPSSDLTATDRVEATTVKGEGR